MRAGFENPDILHVFPTWLWRAELGPAQSAPLNRDLAKTLADLGAPHDLRPGQNWQSDHNLHQDARLSDLMAHVDAAAHSLAGYLRIDAPLAVTGCWANINAPGTAHRLHSHRNNFLSGVYYLQVQEGADSINFFDPRPQAGVIRPPTAQPTAENSEAATVTVQVGTLLLFPAWLQHAVDANRSRVPRITLSFNLMFRDLEKLARPVWTPGIGGPG